MMGISSLLTFFSLSVYTPLCIQPLVIFYLSSIACLLSYVDGRGFSFPLSPSVLTLGVIWLLGFSLYCRLSTVQYHLEVIIAVIWCHIHKIELNFLDQETFLKLFFQYRKSSCGWIGDSRSSNMPAYTCNDKTFLMFNCHCSCVIPIVP